MLKRILVCIGLGTCVMSGIASAGETPTAGGQPAFATEIDVKLSTVRSLIEAKEYESAEKIAEEVVGDSPGTLDGWMMLGYTRTLNGKYELSNDAYDKALAYGADPKEVYTHKAYNCRRLGDPERTRECYHAILNVDENNLDVLTQLGAYELQNENFDDAAECFSAVLQVTPGDIEAIDAMARVEEKRGNAAQVKYWLEKGLSYNPHDEKLLKRIALIYLNEQNYTIAIHYLDQVLENSPDDAGAYRNRGIAFYQRGDRKKAAESFEKVREMGGKMEGLYGPLADCYRSASRRDQALEVIKEGIDAGSQQAWLYSVWGKLLEDQKNYDAAIAKFNKAVGLADEPWSGYARKQIARQAQLKKREAMIAAQGGME